MIGASYSEYFSPARRRRGNRNIRGRAGKYIYTGGKEEWNPLRIGGTIDRQMERVKRSGKSTAIELVTGTVVFLWRLTRADTFALPERSLTYYKFEDSCAKAAQAAHGFWALRKISCIWKCFPWVLKYPIKVARSMEALKAWRVNPQTPLSPARNDEVCSIQNKVTVRAATRARDGHGRGIHGKSTARPVLYAAVRGISSPPTGRYGSRVHGCLEIFS
ncbi:hypothetical protein K438DRAFT_1773349 [Mycena galopus ATCC 62051]|nr:hypothetical protein K438DRAFT_1773349 [Mycena galopus ATCC 62051]